MIDSGPLWLTLSLFITLIVPFVGYPYLRDDEFGTVLGGMLSPALLATGVYAVPTHRYSHPDHSRWFGRRNVTVLIARTIGIHSSSSGQRIAEI